MESDRLEHLLRKILCNLEGLEHHIKHQGERLARIEQRLGGDLKTEASESEDKAGKPSSERETASLKDIWTGTTPAPSSGFGTASSGGGGGFSFGTTPAPTASSGGGGGFSFGTTPAPSSGFGTASSGGGGGFSFG
eukprot:PhF_6_TR27958/c0_g3_i2/m.41282